MTNKLIAVIALAVASIIPTPTVDARPASAPAHHAYSYAKPPAINYTSGRGWYVYAYLNLAHPATVWFTFSGDYYGAPQYRRGQWYLSAGGWFVTAPCILSADKRRVRLWANFASANGNYSVMLSSAVLSCR